MNDGFDTQTAKRILVALKGGPLSIFGIADASGLRPEEVANHVGKMAGKGILVRDAASPPPRWKSDSYRLVSRNEKGTEIDANH